MIFCPDFERALQDQDGAGGGAEHPRRLRLQGRRLDHLLQERENDLDPRAQEVRHRDRIWQPQRPRPLN